MNDKTPRSFWNFVLPLLVSALDGVAFDEKNGDLLVGCSVTSYEVMAAAKNYVEDRGRLLWMHRKFKDGVNEDAVRIAATQQTQGTNGGSIASKPIRIIDYDDTASATTRMGSNSLIPIKTTAEKFNDLIEWMDSHWISEYKESFEDASFSDYILKNSTWVDQEQRFRAAVTNHLLASVEGVIEMRRLWDLDGCGVGLPGHILGEILHHCEWACAKTAAFSGREELLSTALQMCKLGVRESESSASHQKSKTLINAITLAIIGKSGSGKTTLMSKLAEQLKMQAFEQGLYVPVIIRFCGTSSESMTGLQLVRSICHQIEYLMGRPFNSTYIDSMSYLPLVEYFHKLLHEFPVLLFIDSLDQLLDNDMARSHISFLKNISPLPHPDSRIIVSCLPDDDRNQSNLDLVSSNPIDNEIPIYNSRSSKLLNTYFYGCDSKLKESCVPRLEMTLNPKDSIDIFEIILKKKYKRKITVSQKEKVFSAIQIENTALYIELASRVASSWSSSACNEDIELPGGVRSLICLIFEGLEKTYGLLLTSAVLSMITIAVDGISIAELVDVLSLDKDVMNEINKYNTAIRMPNHVLLRLLGGINDLVVTQEGGCLKWYHRQLIEAARIFYAEYLNKYHAIMGRYFGDLIDSSEIIALKITTQPLLLNKPHQRFLPIGRQLFLGLMMKV